MTEHLDDVLSAYLDGELTPDERRRADAHLAACPECRADLAAEGEVRQLLRGLPPVDAPFGFYERVLRDGPAAGQAPTKRRRIRFGLANIVATAAAWLLILAVVNFNHRGSVDPNTADYVTAHASVLPDFGGHRSDPNATAEAKDLDVPDRLEGNFELVGVRRLDGEPQLIYSDGSRLVSMFLRPGTLDVNALPDGTTPGTVNGVPAWHVPTPNGDVVFVQQPGVVVVIVGSQPDQAANAVSGPSGPHASSSGSLWDHLSDAGQGLLETFGLKG